MGQLTGRPLSPGSCPGLVERGENSLLLPVFPSVIRTLTTLFLLASALAAQSLKTPIPNSTPPPIDPAVPKAMDPLLRQFIDVFSVVQSEGADAEPADRLLYGGAIPSMLRQLDPHTQFFDPSQFDQLRQMEASEQKGFGSIVSVLPGQVIFLQTLPGTPSNKAGIQAGDDLVAINNVSIRSLEPEQIVELLSQARQQRIAVYVRRQGSAKLLQFFLTPELVDAPSVDRAFLLNPGFGYLRIASFDLQTAALLRDSLAKLDAAHLRGLVIDLRNNPGGVVTAALDIASQFLPPGAKILTAKGRSSEVSSAVVPDSAKPYSMKLAVIINEKTASAYEILAGALQDHDRAVIVGETSFGKGLVQSVVPLSGNAGLAITTAFYYTPSGRSIQHPLQNSALSQTFNNEHPEQRPVYKTDKGRIVVGGGGIQPDIRVSDQPVTRLEEVLTASGAITAFATEYLQQHPAVADSFNVTPEMLDELKVFLSGRNIQPRLSEWTDEHTWLVRHLQEEIVTQAKGVAKGDEVEATFNPQVQAALKAVTDGTHLVTVQ